MQNGTYNRQTEMAFVDTSQLLSDDRYFGTQSASHCYLVERQMTQHHGSVSFSKPLGTIDPCLPRDCLSTCVAALFEFNLQTALRYRCNSILCQHYAGRLKSYNIRESITELNTKIQFATVKSCTIVKHIRMKLVISQFKLFLKRSSIRFFLFKYSTFFFKDSSVVFNF